MSWLFSRALVEEFSAGTCSDGDADAQLNSTLMRVASYSPGSGMASCQSSQFGTMCEPSTERRGSVALMSSVADSRVPTLAAPADVLGLTGILPGSGEKWRGSLAKYDPDSRTWKTHQTLLFEDSTACLATLPTWGLMRDGELWEQRTPDFPTSESEHGSWPTPKARDWRSGGTDPAKVQARIERRKNQGVIDLPDAAVHRLWQPGFSGQLNPSFSESLMGWPIGWTACEPLETDRFQQWQQQHGDCLAGPSSPPFKETAK